MPFGHFKTLAHSKAAKDFGGEQLLDEAAR